MINISTIEQKLSPVALSPSERAVLEAILPQLGPHMSAWLDQQINNRDFRDDWRSTFVTLLAVKDMFESLAKGWSEVVGDYLARSLRDYDYGLGEHFIPLVLDLKDADRRRSFLSENLRNAMIEFEIALFDSIPEEERTWFLQNKLLWIAGKMPLTESFKQLRLGSPTPELPEWPKPYITALEANEEIISEKAITVDGKTMPSQIRNWVRDFSINTKTPTTARTALDVVQYLQKSPNAQGLDPKQREVLLEILKLYTWLTNTRSFFDEIEEEEKNPKSGSPNGSQSAALSQSPPNSAASPLPAQMPPPKPAVPRPVDNRSAVNLQEQLLAGAGGQSVPRELRPGATVLRPNVPPTPQAPRPTSPPSQSQQKPQVPAPPTPPSPNIPPKQAPPGLRLKPDIPLDKGKTAINVQALLNAEHQTIVGGPSDMKVVPKGVQLQRSDGRLDIEKIKKEIDAKRQGSAAPGAVTSPPTSSTPPSQSSLPATSPKPPSQ